MSVGLLALGDCLPDPAGGDRSSAHERHRAVVDEALLAEALGFDAVWLGEPPTWDDVLAAPPVLLAAIAARTERIRLGTAATRLAILDPVRVAEDYATLDVISGGRVELVAGRGLLGGTGEAGGEETDEQRAVEAEHVALLRRLWTERDVTWSGRFRAPLDGVTVEPRPVQRPHPPIFISGGTGIRSGSPLHAADLAAELGLPLMLPGVGMTAEALVAMAERYRHGFASAGHDPGALRLGACHAVRLRADASPVEVLERLARARQALGLDVQLLRFDLVGLPEAERRRALERFAAEALSALRAAGRSLAAPGAVG